MRLLLDTHAFLWFITNDPHLSATGKALIAAMQASPDRDFDIEPRRLRSPVRDVVL